MNLKFNTDDQTRHDRINDENDAGPIEYLLTKLTNLAFYIRLTTCKTHHNNNIYVNNKRFGE